MKVPDQAAIEDALYYVEGIVRDRNVVPSDFVRHRNRFRNDAAMLGAIYEGGEVLELGAFPCHFTATLKALNYPVIGIDLAPERSKDMVARFGLDLRKCDIERERLPFADGAFRYVLLNEVFEHLRIDPLFVLSEINRVLAGDGTLMLTTPNLYSIQQIVRFLRGRGFGDPLRDFEKLRDIGHMGHVREYSHREIRRFLEYADFKVASVTYRHFHFPASLRGILARIAFTLLPARFRTFQIVLARKSGPGPGLAPLP